MAATLKQTESPPEEWPAAPDGLSTAAAAIDPAVIWSPIESYTAQRFSVRDVVWIAEGPGEWLPPLSPATITTVERWSNGAWVEDATLTASPLGGYVLPCGDYRFTGTVGAEGVPAIVAEAYRRLAEYFAASEGRAGIRSESHESLGSIEYETSGVAGALAKSGAADLLRSFRRAA